MKVRDILAQSWHQWYRAVQNCYRFSALLRPVSQMTILMGNFLVKFPISMYIMYASYRQECYIGGRSIFEDGSWRGKLHTSFKTLQTVPAAAWEMNHVDGVYLSAIEVYAIAFSS